MKKPTPPQASSGVEALIEQLQRQGIAAGQEKAEKIVADAQKRAQWIIDEANHEAQLLLAKARAEAEATRLAGEDALKLAARDSFIHLRDFLLGRFKTEIMLMVRQRLADHAFLERLIVALAGKVREEAGLDRHDAVTIELPAGWFDPGAAAKNPGQVQEGPLSRFVADVTHKLLRDGVRLQPSARLEAGLAIKLADEALEVEFTDQAVAELLLAHLQPRFRALLEGMVRW